MLRDEDAEAEAEIINQLFLGEYTTDTRQAVTTKQ